ATEPKLEAFAGASCITERITDAVGVGKRLLTVRSNTSSDDVCRWVEAHGGYLHDKLMVVEHTSQSRCRGIVARVPLTLPDLHQLPCMAVPEALYMTSRQAEQLLSCHPPSPTAVSAAHLQLQLSSRGGGAGGHQAARRLQPAVSDLQALPPLSTVTKLACLLAHELLAEFGAPTAWAAAVEAAGQAVRLQASLAAALYGQELGVDVDDVVWAAGQVESWLGFGNQEELALAPLIDLLNHQQGAARPQGFEDEDRGERGVATTQTIAYVTSSRHGHPAPLAAGEELFIQYDMSSGDLLKALISFGFIPSELHM
ncbi:hypothetical protein QJQ45_026049, partial [Haematococcus lacustris]